MSRLVHLAPLALMLLIAARAEGTPAPVSPHDTVQVAPAARDTLEGIWRVDDGDPAPIVIRRAPGGYALARQGRWVGTGQLVGHRYEGRFESAPATGDTTRVSGLHAGRFRTDGRLEVTVVYTHGRHGIRHEVWRRIEPIAVPEGPASERVGRATSRR